VKLNSKTALAWLRLIGGVVFLLLLAYLIVDGRADLESVLAVVLLLLGIEKAATGIVSRNGNA